MIAGEHLDLHVLLGEVPERRGGVGAEPVGQPHRGDRPAVGGQLVPLDRPRALQDHHADALGRDRLHLVAEGAGRKHHVGRAQDPGAVLAERRGAPASARGEGDAPVRLPPGRRSG